MMWWLLLIPAILAILFFVLVIVMTIVSIVERQTQGSDWGDVEDPNVWRDKK